jgi:hypothetical protein
MCYKARAGRAECVYQTSSRSTFVTAARFSLALDHGLTMPHASEIANFFEDLSLHSLQPIEVLTLARVRGAAWHQDMCIDAAYHGDFELLKWLHASGCPWDAVDVAINAIRSTNGQYELILPWLLSVVKEWSQERKNELLFETGIANDVLAAELMLQQGAEWPTSFVGEQIIKGETVRACWRFQAIVRAFSKGCSWGEWRCQDLAPALYINDDNREDAEELFEWAHENDCPCTCEAEAAVDDTAVAA